MITAVTRVSLTRIPAKALWLRTLAPSSCRMLTIEADIKLKETAEEKKFIREREKAILDMKHAKELKELEHKFAALERKGNLDAEAEHDAKLTLNVETVKGMLGAGDKLGAEALLKIAKWKLEE